MRFHWICFLVIVYVFGFHYKGNNAVIKRTGRKVPIVLLYADDAKRSALTQINLPKVPTNGNAEEETEERGLALHMMIHGPAAHKDFSFTEDQHAKDKYGNVTAAAVYIPEEEDPVHRRVKRYGHYGGHHGGYHQQHHQPMMHHQQHHHRPPPKKPVSLDFGCNSDNHHVTLTKQHDGSSSSDRTTSAPSSSSSSSDDDDKLLNLFIRRPQHHMRPHHHGPHITFRCNANNHHIFKHFRRSSK